MHQIGNLALFDGAQFFFQSQNPGGDTGTGLNGAHGRKATIIHQQFNFTQVLTVQIEWCAGIRSRSNRERLLPWPCECFPGGKV